MGDVATMGEAMWEAIGSGHLPPMVRVADPSPQQVERAERQRRWSEAMQRMVDAGVPEDARQAFRAYEPRDASEHARRWADGRSRLLCLSGESGSGKSVAAALAVGRLGYAVWLHACDLQWLTPIERDRWTDATTCPLLVVDDLGVERLTEQALSLFVRIVTSRWDSNRRTVLTTNLAAGEIRPRYGDRIARRINDASAFYEVKR